MTPNIYTSITPSEATDGLILTVWSAFLARVSAVLFLNHTLEAGRRMRNLLWGLGITQTIVTSVFFFLGVGTFNIHTLPILSWATPWIAQGKVSTLFPSTRLIAFG